MRIVALALGSLAALLLMMCGAASPSVRLLTAQSVGATRVIGGSPAERGLIRRVLRGIDGSRVLKVKLIDAPPQFVRLRPRRRKSWLVVSAKAKGDADAAFSLWQEALLAGAVRDLAAVQHLRPVAGLTELILTGTSLVPHGAIPIETRRLDRWPFVPMGRIQAIIGSEARGVGLDVESVRFLRPLLYAPVVYIRTDRPEVFLANADRLTFLLTHRLVDGEPPLVDGIFIEVRGPKGRILKIQGYAARLGITNGGTARSR